jgi:hypothetical protein
MFACFLDIRALEKLRFGRQQLIYARFSPSSIEPGPFSACPAKSLRQDIAGSLYKGARQEEQTASESIRRDIVSRCRRACYADTSQIARRAVPLENLQTPACVLF